jgi:hypothetical protein
LIDDPSPAPIPQSILSTSTSLSITPQTDINNPDQPITCKRKQTAIASIVPKKIIFDIQKKIDEGLLKLFTKDFQPFKVVDDEGFKNVVKLLNPSYKIPDRYTISKVQVPALHQKSVNETKELINNE